MVIGIADHRPPLIFLRSRVNVSDSDSPAPSGAICATQRFQPSIPTTHDRSPPPHRIPLAPLHPRIASEMQNHLSCLNSELEGRDFFVGHTLTGNDVQLSFVTLVALRNGGAEAFPHLAPFVTAIKARPADQRAIARSGA